MPDVEIAEMFPAGTTVEGLRAEPDECPSCGFDLKAAEPPASDMTLFCAAVDSETGFLCTRPERHGQRLHVAVHTMPQFSDDHADHHVLAAWADRNPTSSIHHVRLDGTLVEGEPFPPWPTFPSGAVELPWP
jgi:hypothetical protein